MALKLETLPYEVSWLQETGLRSHHFSSVMANRRVVLPLLALAAPLCFTGAWYGAAAPRTVPRSAEAAASTSGSSVALVKVTKEKLGGCVKQMMIKTMLLFCCNQHVA